MTRNSLIALMSVSVEQLKAYAHTEVTDAVTTTVRVHDIECWRREMEHAITLLQMDVVPTVSGPKDDWSIREVAHQQWEVSHISGKVHTATSAAEAVRLHDALIGRF